jgi:hypothetical protein
MTGTFVRDTCGSVLGAGSAAGSAASGASSRAVRRASTCFMDSAERGRDDILELWDILASDADIAEAGGFAEDQEAQRGLARDPLQDQTHQQDD